MDLTGAIITEHAGLQMGRRQVTEAEVRPIREGRVVAHGMVGAYLLRVFVDVDRTPAEVVTVYRTSKVDKYRSRP